MQKLLAGIVGFLTLGGGLIGCDNPSIADKLLPPAASPVSSKALQSGSFSALEQSTHAQINNYRRSKKLPLLTLDSRISAIARAHSQAMADGKVPFSHQGVERRYKAIQGVIPYRQVAENVAYNKGFSTPDTQAVQGWIKSTGHRINMEGPYQTTGIGVAKNAKGEYYFTQLFVRPQ